VNSINYSSVFCSDAIYCMHRDYDMFYHVQYILALEIRFLQLLS